VTAPKLPTLWVLLPKDDSDFQYDQEPLLAFIDAEAAKSAQEPDDRSPVAYNAVVLSDRVDAAEALTIEHGISEARSMSGLEVTGRLWAKGSDFRFGATPTAVVKVPLLGPFDTPRIVKWRDRYFVRGDQPSYPQELVPTDYFEEAPYEAN
jgi:hypothetical protein